MTDDKKLESLEARIRKALEYRWKEVYDGGDEDYKLIKLGSHWQFHQLMKLIKGDT